MEPCESSTMPLQLVHAAMGLAFLAIWAIIGDLLIHPR